MIVPKFKPTKWQVSVCNDCNKVLVYGRCFHTHPISQIPNVPFFCETMQITNFVNYKNSWFDAHSIDLNQKYIISVSKLFEAIKHIGIESGGMIKNQWWMFAKVGSILSLQLVKSGGK